MKTEIFFPELNEFMSQNLNNSVKNNRNLAKLFEERLASKYEKISLPASLVYSMLAFDMDGTLVSYNANDFKSSWSMLGKIAGLEKVFEDSIKKYYNQRDKYEEWVLYNASFLKGMNAEEIKKQMLDILDNSYSNNAVDVVKAASKYFKHVGVVTSGLDFVAEKVKKDMNLDFALANHLVVKDGKFTGDAVINVPLWRKDEALESICKQYRLSFYDVIFVGDNENDIPVFEKVGLSIGFNLAKNQNNKHVSTDVSRFVDFEINDMKELAYLLKFPLY